MAKLGEKPTEELAQIALEWLDNIDILRVKSGHIQGIISGKMKKRILGVAEAIRQLQIRCDATGDASFLQKRNTELEAKLRAGKAAEGRLKEDLRNAKGVIKDLRRETNELKERMGSESSSGGNTGEARKRRSAREPHQDAETVRLREAINACDRRIDYLMSLREAGRKQVEDGEWIGGKKLLPPTPRGHQKLLPRGKGKKSRGILSTETETETVSEGERFTNSGNRPLGREAWPPVKKVEFMEYEDGEHGRGRKGRHEGILRKESGQVSRRIRM